jgi:hypothetical protein
MPLKTTQSNLVSALSEGTDFSNEGFDIDFNVCPFNLDFLIEAADVTIISNPKGLIINSAVFLTPDGGVATKMINKTGATSIKGTIAHHHATIDFGFELCPDDEADQIGVIYGDDDGNQVADGAECWVVSNGRALIYFESATTLGHFVRSQVAGDGGTIGYAIAEAAPTSPFSSDKHFQEIGHVLEATGAAGLAMCVLHSN